MFLPFEKTPLPLVLPLPVRLSGPHFTQHGLHLDSGHFEIVVIGYHLRIQPCGLSLKGNFHYDSGIVSVAQLDEGPFAADAHFYDFGQVYVGQRGGLFLHVCSV